MNGAAWTLGAVAGLAVAGLARPRGSRSLEPAITKETKAGGLRVRTQIFPVGMSVAAYGSALTVGKKASTEFVLVTRSFTRDTTLSTRWTSPIDDLFAANGIRDTDRAVYLELVKLPRDAHGKGLGRAMVERILTTARSEGARVALLISKHFAYAGRPLAFWKHMGFEPLADASDLGGGRGTSLPVGSVVLMGKIL